MSKVLLRPWQFQDAPSLASIANNKKLWDNMRDQLPHPYTITDAQQWIAHCKEQNPIVNFAVIYDGQIAGSIGCVPKSDVYRKTIEIGYFIGENYWGKGIATEAISVLLEYIQNHFDVIRIYAEIFENNKASMKVLQKNGFYLESIRRKGVIKNNIVLDDYIWAKLV